MSQSALTFKLMLILGVTVMLVFGPTNPFIYTSAAPHLQESPLETPNEEPAPAAEEASPAEQAPPAAEEAPPAEQAAPESLPDEIPALDNAPEEPAEPDSNGERFSVAPEPDLAAADDSTLVLDEAEFIDTMVVSVAYVWFCCGAILLVLAPFIFLFAYVRGRNQIVKHDL